MTDEQKQFLDDVQAGKRDAKLPKTSDLCCTHGVYDPDNLCMCECHIAGDRSWQSLKKVKSNIDELANGPLFQRRLF